MSGSLTPIEKIRYLSPRLISILGCNPSPYTLLGTNTYLVGTGKERILVDAGDPDVEEYQSLLTKVLSDTRSFISKIIVTHFHHDHIGGVDNVRKLCNRDIPAYKLDFQCDEQRSLNGQYPCPIEFVKDKHVFEVEGAHLTVHYNPGHTNDHMVLWLEEEKSVLSADTVLGEGTTSFQDLTQYMKSLHAIKDLKPEVIHPGHGPVISSPEETLEYYIKHRQDRENQIIDLLRQSPHSTSDVVKVLYKDYPEEVHIAAKRIILMQFYKLHDDGKVQYNGDRKSYDTVWTLDAKAAL